MLASDSRRWLAAALACGTLACARNPAPRGWLAPAREAQADRYGAWIVVSRLGDTLDLSGEFLAVERDSIFVLSLDGDVSTVPLDQLRRAQIAFYDARSGRVALWTTIGALSTISNGVVLVFTFPLWTIAGPIVTGAQSRAPLRRVDRDQDWDAFRMYARFPAGLPPNLPRKLPPRGGADGGHSSNIDSVRWTAPRSPAAAQITATATETEA